MLAAYPNCLGVLAGNEVVNDSNTVRAVPVIRAVVRDLKRYLRLKHEVTGQRVLPVGYSAADVRDLEDFTRDYLSAGDEASRLDFWSVSLSEALLGCGTILLTRHRRTTIRGRVLRICRSADTAIRYVYAFNFSVILRAEIRLTPTKVEHNSHLHIPAFFSEYGANTNSPRDFGETAAMLSPEMTHIFSGGFVYEFWRSGNGFGLVKRPTGQEAAKWRGVHNSFQTALAEGASKKTANMTLGQYANTEGGGGLKFEDPPGTPRRLDRNIAEYRETSIGEIILYRDFLNLKERLAAAKDIEMNTDPDWVDSGITATRAPAFPSDRRFRAVGGEENVPETCVDWARVEESIRDDEYVLVGEN